jgi:hypothetical protein
MADLCLEAAGEHLMAMRFQFSLWNLLEAMIWLCVCLGSFAILRTIVNAPIDDDPWTGLASVVLAFSLFVLLVSSPFVAIGALFGRTRTGAFVGLTLVLLYLLATLVVEIAMRVL